MLRHNGLGEVGSSARASLRELLNGNLDNSYKDDRITEVKCPNKNSEF